MATKTQVKVIIFAILSLTFISCEPDQPNDCRVGYIREIISKDTTQITPQLIIKHKIIIEDFCSKNLNTVTITTIDGTNEIFQPLDIEIGKFIQY